MPAVMRVWITGTVRGWTPGEPESSVFVQPNPKESMPSDNESPKPMPSAEEINAYLELSAARTRKRLPLAAGNAVPLKASEPRDRKLRVTGSAVPGTRTEKPAPEALRGVAERAPEGPGEPEWSPFSKDKKA
jgi:hypothetical protein